MTDLFKFEKQGMGTSPLTIARFAWRACRKVRLLALLLIVSAWWAAAGSAAAAGEGQVHYVIVVTGGELLSGVYPDGHTYFLTRTLRPLGMRCAGSMCVDDNPADLEEALRFATGKASLVIVTGGLGPTDNDITRETLSEFTGIPLREDPDVLNAMAGRFGVSPDGLRANLRRQTQVPSRGTYLKNSNGTAVGLVFETKDHVIVALPGPPRELQTMVQRELIPYLNRRFGTRLPGCSLTLRFVGLGQSQIDQTLEDHVPLPSDITISSQFEGSRVDFTFALPDDTPQGRSRLDELKQRILQHLGDYVYADDQTSLEEHVVRLLRGRGATLALADVGSGGRLAANLGGTEGADQVLAGAFAASTEEKLRRILRVPDDAWAASTSGAERAELLAQAAADATGSRWALAVGQIRQEPSGTRHVEVVFKLPNAPPDRRRIRLRGDGPPARLRLTTELLDQLRHALK